MLLFQEEKLDGKDLDLSPVQKEFICTLRYDDYFVNVSFFHLSYYFLGVFKYNFFRTHFLKPQSITLFFPHCYIFSIKFNRKTEIENYQGSGLKKIKNMLYT